MNRPLEIIDIFGRPFNFTINGQLKFKTLFGGFLSIIYLAACFCLTFVFAKDFFERTHPKVIDQLLELTEYPIRYVANDNFTVAWRIEDESGNVMNNVDDILFPKTEYHNYKLSNKNGASLFEKVKSEYIPSRKCEKISKTLEHTFKKEFSVSQWNCLDFSDSNSQKMGGYWNTEFLHYLSFGLITCDESKENEENFKNLSNKKKCASYEDLEKLLEEEVYLSLLFPQTVVNYEDYEDPKKTIYINYHVRLNLGISAYDKCDFGETVLTDDKGYAIESPKTKSSIGFDECKSSFNLLDLKKFQKKEEEGISNEIYFSEFYLKKNIHFIKRFYMKIQEAAALMGGVQSSVFLILHFIARFFNDFQRNNMLIDLIFKFPIDEEENKRIYEELKRINANIRKNTTSLIEENLNLNNNIIDDNLNEGKNDENICFKKPNNQRIEVLKAINKKVKNIKKNLRNSQMDSDVVNFENNGSFAYNSQEPNNISSKDKLYKVEKLNNTNDLIAVNKNAISPDIQMPEKHTSEKQKVGIPSPDKKINYNRVNENSTYGKSMHKETIKENTNINSKSIQYNFNSIFNNSDINLDRKIELNLEDKDSTRKMQDEEKYSNLWVSVIIKNLINKKRKLFSQIGLNLVNFKIPCCRRKRNTNKEYKYFDQAITKILKRVDLVRYVKNYQVTKTLSRLILNNEQCFYMKNIFQKVIKIPASDNKEIKLQKKKEEIDQMLAYLENMVKGDLENMNQTDETILNNLLEK